MFSFFPDLISVQNLKRNTTVEPRYNERPRFVRYNEIEVFVIWRNVFLCFTISEAKKIVRLIYRGLRYIEVPLYVRITLIIYHCENYPIVIGLVPFSELKKQRNCFRNCTVLFESDRIPHFNQGFAWAGCQKRNHKGEAVYL